jgi:hypothetical protein
LFEGGFDIFEEDGGVKGKGRKRTRFGRDSNAWRYTSQSPSPEHASPVYDMADEDMPDHSAVQASPKPEMMDEGCQTMEVSTPEAVSAQVGANASTSGVSQQVATPPPPESPIAPEEDSADLAQQDQAHIPERESASIKPVRRDRSVPSESERLDSASHEESHPSAQIASLRQSKDPSAQDQTTHVTGAELPQPNLSPTKNSETYSAILFGNSKPSGSSFSMFGTGVPSSTESTLSIADQVRFGFSHNPQITHAPIALTNDAAHENDNKEHEAYPESYLDNQPAPAKIADMTGYANAADGHSEFTAPDQNMAPEPPAVQHFREGQWEVSTQNAYYNPVEGVHFGADTLNEGTVISDGQASLDADKVTPRNVPAGFASYGREEAFGGPLKEPPQDQNAVENGETTHAAEGSDRGGEEEDAAYDKYAYGGRIQQGDYDQRHYDIPSDDDEGLSEEEDEAEQEARDRYGYSETYDEDGEGEYWDEEEEGYDESEDEEDEHEHDEGSHLSQSLRKPTAPAQSSGPVVISLLSDSEEDDEPVPGPRKPSPATETHPAQRSPKRSTSPPDATSSRHRGSPDMVESEKRDTSDFGAGHGQPATDIFTQTQVIDFGSFDRVNAQPRSPKAETDSPSEASRSTSQASYSFEEVESRPYFRNVDAERASSETSSEGLFVSQPRAEYFEAADEPIDDGSGYESDDVVEVTGTVRENGLADEGQIECHVIMEDDKIRVEEVVQDDRLSKEPDEAQDSEGSLTDDDGGSFASQIEMSQDLELVGDEDRTGDGSSKLGDAAGSVQSDLGVEEIVTSDDDVDMIDVDSAHQGGDHEENQPSQPLREEEYSDLVISAATFIETVSETSVKAGPAGNPLLDDQTVQKDAQTQASAGVERELDVPQPGETAVIMPNGENHAFLPEPESPAIQSLEPEMAEHEVPPSASPESSRSVPRGVQEPLTPSQSQLAEEMKLYEERRAKTPELLTGDSIEGVDSSPIEAQYWGQESPSIRRKVISGTQDGRSPRMVTVSGTQEEYRAIPESSIPAQPTDADMEGPILDDELTLHSRADQDGQEPELIEQPVSTPKTPTQASLTTGDQSAQEGQSFTEVDESQTEPPFGSPSQDISIQLARQAVAARRSKKASEPKKSTEPLRTSPRLTRGRSSSLQTNPTPEREEPDSSINLARAALASPSKADTTGALKSDLTRRLRTDLPECVPLNSLRNHNEMFPNVVAIVTSHPTPATRAKGGPREYFMSFHVTDPSMAPTGVVEVQLYRPHKDSLPVVKPGDAVLLQRFQVKALTKKGWGLRTQSESAWAVFEGGGADHAAGEGEGDEKEKGASWTVPQIKGPPVEDYENYVEYVGLLRKWYRSMVADPAARAKLERADKKLAGF